MREAWPRCGGARWRIRNAPRPAGQRRLATTDGAFCRAVWEQPAHLAEHAPRPRRIKGHAVAALCTLVRWQRIVFRRLVLAAALVRLVCILHLEPVPLARAFEVCTAEASAGVVVAQSVGAHARVLVLADATAHSVAAIALPNGPQAKALKESDRLCATERARFHLFCHIAFE